MARIIKREDNIELPFVDFSVVSETNEEIAERKSALGQDQDNNENK